MQEILAKMQMRFAFGEVEIPVTAASWDTLFETIEQRLTAGRGFALATINLDHLVKLENSPKFRAAYAQHDIIVADGNPIVWLSRLAKRPVELIPGSDLIAPLCDRARDLGVPIAFFGSSPDVLEKAAQTLCATRPGLQVASRIAPPMGFAPDGPEAAQYVSQIQNSGARLCFIALGAPKQEEFAAYARQLAPGIGFVSIGAGLDFLAGHQTRAPRVVRALALEWLWRMALSPRRLALRYLACAKILPRHLRAAHRLRVDAS